MVGNCDAEDGSGSAHRGVGAASSLKWVLTAQLTKGPGLKPPCLAADDRGLKPAATPEKGLSLGGDRDGKRQEAAVAAVGDAAGRTAGDGDVVAREGEVRVVERDVRVGGGGADGGGLLRNDVVECEAEAMRGVEPVDRDAARPLDEDVAEANVQILRRLVALRGVDLVVARRAGVSSDGDGVGARANADVVELHVAHQAA